MIINCIDAIRFSQINMTERLWNWLHCVVGSNSGNNYYLALQVQTIIVVYNLVSLQSVIPKVSHENSLSGVVNFVRAAKSSVKQIVTRVLRVSARVCVLHLCSFSTVIFRTDSHFGAQNLWVKKKLHINIG